MSSRQTEINACLDGSVDGKAFSVRSSGRQTIVEVPDVATGLRLMRLGSPRGFWKPIHQWKRLLDSLSHEVELRIRGRTVGRMGHEIGNRGWALLGLPAMTVKPSIVSYLLAANSRKPTETAPLD